MHTFYSGNPYQYGQLAYTAGDGAGYDIWLYDFFSRSSTRLTTGLADSFSIPYWSPDLNRIAFVGRGAVIYVVNLERGTIAAIDQLEEGPGSYLDWSPDGVTLAYAKNPYIMIYNTRTHRANRINQPQATDVQWFPTGEELLYQAPDDSGVSQLYRIDRNGTNQRQITQNTEGRYNNVRLSPNGRYILYTTPGVSVSLIYTIDLITGEVFEIPGGPQAKNYNPEWSPDSQSILYSATAMENNQYYSQIRTTGTRGQGDRPIAISTCFSTPVTWSGNGRRIAYLSGCTAEDYATEVWVLDVISGASARILAGIPVFALQWSPIPTQRRKRTFVSQEYRVRLRYPANWQQVTDVRFEGPDGFFQISAIASDEPIEEVCQNEAFHPLQPYGSNPRITRTRTQGQEACFIFPSADQPAEMENQAALIVRYPRPVQINGETYNYFVLWADEAHIDEISPTIDFLGNR
ncbi:TolB family protein [Virgibacillus kekensis]|uniref:TolB family protein n=1 Tax=Virgibacillus kekensis TaxID=202261 RepID=A0ABV9DKA8_9BACI